MVVEVEVEAVADVAWLVQVIVSEYNKLDEEKYYDSESHTSFVFDHVTQVCRTTFVVYFLGHLLTVFGREHLLCSRIHWTRRMQI